MNKQFKFKVYREIFARHLAQTEHAPLMFLRELLRNLLVSCNPQLVTSTVLSNAHPARLPQTEAMESVVKENARKFKQESESVHTDLDLLLPQHLPRHLLQDLLQDLLLPVVITVHLHAPRENKTFKYRELMEVSAHLHAIPQDLAQPMYQKELRVNQNACFKINLVTSTVLLLAFLYSQTSRTSVAKENVNRLRAVFLVFARIQTKHLPLENFPLHRFFS